MFPISCVLSVCGLYVVEECSHRGTCTGQLCLIPHAIIQLKLGPFLNVYLLFSSFIKLSGESATTSANTEKIILNLYLAYIYACTCSWS